MSTSKQFSAPAVRLSSFAPALLALALASAGCAVEPAAELDEAEQMRLIIMTVPEDVRCLRITAAGLGRTVVRELEATPGMSVSKGFSGLPLGPVTVTGEAFPGACDSVTKSTTASWVSEPVEVSIALGRVAGVDLVMSRNGRARLEVSFNDEPICTAGGGACLSSTECCSRSCVQHQCAPTDGGADGPGGM